MHLKVKCNDCFQAGQKHESYIELTDDIYYKFECENGHRKNIILQERKFEILFEFGAIALMEGFTREAVSSFAASLERFYEYFLKTLMLHRGISFEQIAEMWKDMDKQSERQLGAFLTIYTTHFNQPPTRIDGKEYSRYFKNSNHPSVTSFRNAVIHKGYIPKYDEVLAYGEAIKFFISETLKLIYTKEYIETHLLLTKLTRQSLEINKDFGLTSIWSLPTILKWTVPDNLNRSTLKEVLEEASDLKQFRVILPVPPKSLEAKVTSDHIY